MRTDDSIYLKAMPRPISFGRGLAAWLVLACGICLGVANAADYYVDSSAPQSGTGERDKPFRSIAQALGVTDGVGGVIHLAAGGIYLGPVVVRQGGQADRPLVIDGQDSVLLLGKDITSGPWTSLGDEYRLEQAVPPHVRPYVSSPVFVNGLPVWADHPQGRGQPSWHGGSVRYDEQGRLVLRLPRGLSLDTAVIVLAGSDQVSGLQVTGGGHVVVKNLTVGFAGNDGFNFHNNCRDVHLENVTAVFNGDQGISSHDTCEVEVRDSEVAFNGSQSGGIVDIGRSVTHYVNVSVHHNRFHAFDLQGARHTLSGIRSYGNLGYNLPKPLDKILMKECQDGGTSAAGRLVPVITGPLQTTSPVDPADRLGRFLRMKACLDEAATR